MSIAWLLKKDGGILAWQKIRKKKQNRFLLSNDFNVYKMEVPKHFAAKT